MDDDIERSETACPKCDSETLTRQCNYCEDGMSDHDCGDDTCVCFAPEDNVRCDMCEGHGYNHWCPTCGWDLVSLRYIGGHTVVRKTPHFSDK